MCLCTLAYSPFLSDISNIVRFTLLAFATLACFLAMPARSLHLPFGIGTVSFLLFIAVQCLSMLWASNFAEALFEVSKWMLLACILILAFNAARRNAVRFVIAMSWASAAVATVALAVAGWQTSHLGDLSWNSRYSIVSLFTHKSTFSIMIIMTMAFPIMRLRLNVRRGRVFFVAMIAFLAVVLSFLTSRAALLAFAASGFAALVMRIVSRCNIRHRWLWTLILASAIALTVVAGSRSFAMRPQQEASQADGLLANASILERQSLWRMTFRMIDKHPLMGCGTGNWKIAYPDATTEDVFSINQLDLSFMRPHNDYLRIAAETGLPSLFLLLVALSSLIARATACRRQTRHGTIARTAAAFLCGIMVFAIVDFSLDRIEVPLWTSLMCAIIMATTPAIKHSNNQAFKYSITHAFILLILSLTALLGISRWRSESHHPGIVAGINDKAWPDVERHCRKAATPFYSITPLGMPLAYYEAMAMEQQHKDALPAFRRALAASPHCKQALTDMGRLQYTQCHNADSAIICLEEAIRISPGYTNAYINLAQVYMHEKRPCDALAAARRLDMKKRKEQIEKMVWHYYEVSEAEYYTLYLIPSQEKAIDRIIQRAEGLCTQDSSTQALKHSSIQAFKHSSILQPQCRDKRDVVDIVLQATSFTGVERVVIAPITLPHGENEEGRHLLAEIPVVAVGAVLATAYLGGNL